MARTGELTAEMERAGAWGFHAGVEITGTTKELEMHTNTQLPEPSSKHATCAWCALQIGTVVELIDHVDELHLADKRGFHLLEPVGAGQVPHAQRT